MEKHISERAESSTGMVSHFDEDFAGTEASLQRREAALRLKEIEELLGDIPRDAIAPHQHEEIMALKENVSTLVEDMR